MKVFLVFALLAVCAFAQPPTVDEATTNATETQQPTSPEQALLAQVQFEQQSSRAYIDTLMKLQHSQLQIQAANEFSKVFLLLQGGDLSDGAAAAMGSPNPAVNLGYGGFQAMGQGVQAEEPETGDRALHKAKLLGAYQLFYSLKMKFYSAVFRSADVQNEFWQDRAMQLYIQSAGDAVPPAILQLMFVKLYRTNLETLKTSLQFQYLSHFVTWLEDELDVCGSMLENSLGDDVQPLIREEQQDDLIRDRMFAFTAFNSFAQLDFQTFYFDLYLESATTGGSFGSLGGSVPATDANASFLETESTTKFTDILATGSFGAGVNTQPYLFLKVYKFYYLLFQMYAAHSGMTSAYSAHASYDMVNQGGDYGQDKIEDFGNFGETMLYGQYASNLRYGAQMEYISALYELYLIYAPLAAAVAQGSFSSFGSL